MDKELIQDVIDRILKDNIGKTGYVEALRELNSRFPMNYHHVNNIRKYESTEFKDGAPAESYAAKKR